MYHLACTTVAAPPTQEGGRGKALKSCRLLRMEKLWPRLAYPSSHAPTLAAHVRPHITARATSTAATRVRMEQPARRRSTSSHCTDRSRNSRLVPGQTAHAQRHGTAARESTAATSARRANPVQECPKWCAGTLGSLRQEFRTSHPRVVPKQRRWQYGLAR